MPLWKFRHMSKGEVAVEPVQRQFFTTNIVGGLSAAIVRESIQNSIDARLKNDSKPVFVEYRLLEIESTEFVKGLFLGLTEHLNIENSLIDKSHISELNKSIRLLIIEDYNTIGLAGDIFEHRDPDKNDGKHHNFYWFWRRIGESGKRGEDIGRWGLGKTVFPASSQINTFFGVTCREEDNGKFLMGLSILNTHFLSDGLKEVKHSPYGYYGNFNDAEDEFFVIPLINDTDKSFIKEFEQNLKLQRTNPDNGNSLLGFSAVVINPWKEINSNEIGKAVLEQFYYPILTRDLIVKIEDQDESIEISNNTIESFLETLEFGEHEAYKPTEIKNLISLSNWALSLDNKDYIILKEPQLFSDPIWRKDWFVDDDLEELIDSKATNFFQGERIAFKVPVKVQESNSDPEFCYFKVYLEYDKELNTGENYFIRDGITVSGMKPFIKKGLRVLVTIEKNKLASLLGDSENPAHTEWQRKTKELLMKYKSPEKTISFVINSIKSLYSYIIKH